jgi:type II secretory pathway pseudopilin PulG
MSHHDVASVPHGQSPHPRLPRRSRPRAGFTLAELLLTITLTIGVFAAAVPFFTMQMRQLAQDVGRTDAQQTARYAQNMVDRELRNIGIGVQPMDAALGIPRNQPKIVQAHARAVTFNTDLIANDTSDVEAVYYDPNVPNSLTLAMNTGATITLPYASKSYPDFTYKKSDGSISMAETVSYWVSPDSSQASSSNLYVLFRRVNDGPISVVATGIELVGTQPFFKYNRVLANGQIDSIATSSLPVYWDATASIADSIRTVTMSVTGVFNGYNLQNKKQKFSRTVNSQTSMANMGLAQRNSCGDVPLNPGVPVTAVSVDPFTLVTTSVRLTWTSSPDETSGEKDVERYAIFRRIVGDPWGAPVDQVGKSNSPSYSWDDFDIQPGTSFEYGISAQDCSPANSSMRVSAAVTH